MPKTLGIDSVLAREARQWATRILQMSMMYRELSYRELADRLNAMRVQENERNLRNKIGRGEFSASFFLICLKAMEMDHLRVADWAWLASLRKSRPLESENEQIVGD
ncbi:MAG TPA: DUF6471 domain-containing protein [Rhizomicrobium sp.]|nr:DUF6471 domain-containing protein [Rhizomicrobium sp.]